MIIRIYSIIPIFLQVFKTGGLAELHWVIRLNVLEKIYSICFQGIGNITCAFKNQEPFKRLQIKSECFYYLGNRKKNRDFISNLITWNLSNKSIITHKKFTTCSTQKSKQIYFLHSFSLSAFFPWKENELWLFFLLILYICTVWIPCSPWLC